MAYDAHHHDLARVTPGCIATGEPASAAHVLARRPWQHVAVGLHPWWCSVPADLERLDGLPFDQADAIGEVGLDRLRGDASVQEAATTRQLALAHVHDLPVIVHCVRAHDRMHGLLRGWRGRGMVHGWTGSAEQTVPFLSAGLHVSFGPALLRSAKVQRALRVVPSDRILLESDAHDAGDLDLIAAFAGEILGRPDLVDQANANARALFPRTLLTTELS